MTTNIPTRKSDAISTLTHGTPVKNKEDGKNSAKQLDGQLGEAYEYTQKAKLALTEATLLTGKADTDAKKFLLKAVKAVSAKLDAVAVHVHNLRQSSRETLNARQSATQTKTTPSASSAPRRHGR